MLINLRNALMAGKRLPYDAEVEYLRVDAVGPYIVIDGVTYCNAVGTYYAFTISSGGVVTHDFIPVRLGNTGYMYDRITNKRFGNAGTGDFVLGPDVVPVEYIESHGTEWIDTGVVGYKTTKIESSCALKNATTAYPAMWGARTNSYINDFQVYYRATSIGGIPTSIILRTGNSQKEISMSDIGASTLIGTRLNVIVADGTIYVNDRAFTTPAFSNFTTPHSILAFCQYSSRPANKGAFVYWGLKMWQGESLIRSFCPVRVGTGSTWEGAMMDTLTRRIYRNAGTGAFSYGNDLKYPIPA